MFSRVLRSSANTARLRTRHVGGARKFSVPPKAAKPCNGKPQGSDDSHINSGVLPIVLPICLILGVLHARTEEQNKEILRSLQYLIDKTDA